MNEVQIRVNASDHTLKNAFAEIMLDDGVRLKLALYYKSGKIDALCHQVLQKATR
ncbi:hypothetical protein [Aliiroseovarius sp. S253]|uniref:hypothetical protein n=1 Tax=Aliiroseovarius sp. S253 TaxID=3415133 RepID=UPI003C7B3FE7